MGPGQSSQRLEPVLECMRRPVAEHTIQLVLSSLLVLETHIPLQVPRIHTPLPELGIRTPLLVLKIHTPMQQELSLVLSPLNRKSSVMQHMQHRLLLPMWLEQKR
jgi:hypothetical protein